LGFFNLRFNQPQIQFFPQKTKTRTQSYVHIIILRGYLGVAHVLIMPYNLMCVCVCVQIHTSFFVFIIARLSQKLEARPVAPWNGSSLAYS